MQIINNIVKGGFLIACISLCSNAAMAQATASQARQYIAEKNYEKGLNIYAEVYGLNPDSVYTEYLNTLINLKKYKQAEKVVEKQMTLRQNAFLQIDLGNVLALEGNAAKAKEKFDALINTVNGDDMYTQRLVKAFSDGGRDEYAIAAYEKAISILGAPFAYIYSGQLAKLHAKTGNLEKALDALIVAYPGQAVNLDNAKEILLEILGADAAKLQQTQKLLVKKINEQPDNVYFAEILTWIYTQKNDWDGALIQIEAIDERNKEDGRRLMDLARAAIAAKQYEPAGRAYDDVIAKGPELPFYVMAKSEKLNAALVNLTGNHVWKPEDVAALAIQYDTFLAQYPKYYCMQTASDYAMLLARYADKVPQAIEVLKKAVAEPDTRRNMAGAFKLQMGDYYLLLGKLWDASLTYSQVDKDFKQDAMGEDARFRNAKLAYYRGDFEWAQRQLSILKASTSQLIANDALYLSVLITENVEDSLTLPLERFAHAGLLAEQNKDKAAELVLDSLNHEYPTHPLCDDILMFRAEMARKKHDYDKAIGYLKTIYEKYKEDVLGDDAVFKMAEIYQYDLHQKDKAREYYEQLIIDYMGSTYVQTSRQRLKELKSEAQ